MRYIAKVLKSSLHEKFPDATEDELLKVDFWGQTASSLFFLMPKGIFIDTKHSKELRTPAFSEGTWHFLGYKGVVQGEEKGTLLPQPSYLNLSAQQFLWKTELNLLWIVTVLWRLEFIWIILGFGFVLWYLSPAILSWGSLWSSSPTLPPEVVNVLKNVLEEIALIL